MSIDQIKKEVLEWTSGLHLEGENEQDLLDSLKSVHWSLECELDREYRIFEERIRSLNL